jgi:hypothetical protein
MYDGKLISDLLSTVERVRNSSHESSDHANTQNPAADPIGNTENSKGIAKGRITRAGVWSERG